MDCDAEDNKPVVDGEAAWKTLEGGVPASAVSPSSDSRKDACVQAGNSGAADKDMMNSRERHTSTSSADAPPTEVASANEAAGDRGPACAAAPSGPAEARREVLEAPGVEGGREGGEAAREPACKHLPSLELLDECVRRTGL